MYVRMYMSVRVYWFLKQVYSRVNYHTHQNRWLQSMHCNDENGQWFCSCYSYQVHVRSVVLSDTRTYSICTTVDLEIFVVKIFSWATLTTKIKNTK